MNRPMVFSYGTSMADHSTSFRARIELLQKSSDEPTDPGGIRDIRAGWLTSHHVWLPPNGSHPARHFLRLDGRAMAAQPWTNPSTLLHEHAGYPGLK